MLAEPTDVLEVGSGTGQHAVYFGERLPHVRWQTSDRASNHPGIEAWVSDAALPNVLPPLTLDVTSEPWPVSQVGAAFSANTVHIMSWPAVQSFFRGVARILEPGGKLLLYGPFNYGGRYTSESNARFDEWLRSRDSASGIRDFEAIDGEAAQVGLVLSDDVEMPANNRLLIWEAPRTTDRG